MRYERKYFWIRIEQDYLIAERVPSIVYGYLYFTPICEHGITHADVDIVEEVKLPDKIIEMDDLLS